ncbi:MAG: response regulator [Candidatus Wildermuthbacteria bacterium]|nr:response regulator [Candidatus Wildermuthbacteria bacterium]
MAKKILIIEDEDILMQMYTEKLEREGFSVVQASSSREGFNVAVKEKPDFILLDLLLQDENGLSFLWKKQDDPIIGKIPVLVFSNYDDPTPKKEALKLGALGYLVKTDYTPQQIIDKITSYIETPDNAAKSAKNSGQKPSS